MMNRFLQILRLYFCAWTFERIPRVSRAQVLVLALATSIMGCGSSSGEPRPATLTFRRFDEVEQRTLSEKLSKVRFPCLKVDLWRGLGVKKEELKPWFNALASGVFWEQYYLNDDTFLILRTLWD